MEIYSNMGAKNTENMAQASQEKNERVLLVIWGEFSTKTKTNNNNNNNNEGNILACFNLRHQMHIIQSCVKS